MTEQVSEKRPWSRPVETVITWASRLIGVFCLLVVGYWWTQQLSRHSGADLLWPGSFATVFCFGLILAWKSKIVGGVLASVAVGGLYLTVLLLDGWVDDGSKLLFVFLALPGLLSIFAGVFRSRRGRRTRISFSSFRCPFALFGVYCIAVVGWWLLFGHSYPGLARAKRFFGRETLVQSDRNSDGQVDIERRYSWHDPFRWDDATGWTSGIPVSERWDADYDGNWDTWVTREGNDIFGMPVLKYAVDLTADGEPDWSFSLTICDTSARERIEAIRGF